MAVNTEVGLAVDRHPVVPCKWCGQRSRPGPACDVCGSPMDLRFLARPAVEDPSPQQLPPSAPVERTAPRLLVVPPTYPEGQGRPVVEPLVVVPEAPPVTLDDHADHHLGPSWGVLPIPALRTRARNELIRTWVTRVAAFFGLGLLLDFLLSHL